MTGATTGATGSSTEPPLHVGPAVPPDAAGPWPPPPTSPPPPPPVAPPVSRPEPSPGAPGALALPGSLGQQLAAGVAPETRAAGWTWLLFAAFGFLGGQVLAAVFATVAAEAAGQLHSLSAIARLSEPPTWYIISTLLGLWAGFFGSAWLASSARGTKSIVRDMGLRFRLVDLVGIPIGVGGQVLVALMYVPISHHVHNFSQRFNAPSQRLTGGSHGAGYTVIAILTVVGAPFFEELFFRGVLLRALARLFGTFGGWVGPALAILTTGVLFGLAHDESLQFIGLATFGVILSVVAYRTGRLGMNMVAHASFNLVAVAAAVVPVALGTGAVLR